MAEIQNISIELVKVHPNNVRKTYNDIEELAESIKAKGILQNLTVVPDPQEPGKYLTVIGNRRLTAARMAGLETVPEMSFAVLLATTTMSKPLLNMSSCSL